MLRVMLTVASITVCMPLRAGILPTYSIRHLAIEADTIAVATPGAAVGGTLPSTWKIKEVLKGKETLLGQEIGFECTWIDPRFPSPLFVHRFPGKPAPRIEKALLFLSSPQQDEGREVHSLMLSGIRAMAEGGQMFVLQKNSKKQHLDPADGVKWDAIYAQIAADLPEIAKVRKIGEIADRGERNKAVFAWIDSHRDEFGGGTFDTGQKGWSSLEWELFNWIMESCIADDCWKAKHLAKELGTGPNGYYPSYCSKEGRSFLIARITEGSLSALQELSGNMWYSYRAKFPRTSVITHDEQKQVIDMVLPMLKNDDAAWRGAAVRCLLAASWPYDANFHEFIDKRCVPDFVKLYKSEKNTEVRTEVVNAIRRLEDEAFWQKISGNPAGIVVIPRFHYMENGTIKFQVNLDHTRAKITDAPVFRFQKIEADGATSKPRIINPMDGHWKKELEVGWDGGAVAFDVPAAGLKPGLWRVSLEGVFQDIPWRSEPIELAIPASAED